MSTTAAYGGPVPPRSALAISATHERATALAADLEAVLERVERMPSQRPAITHILNTLSMDASGATDLARALTMDPVLASRVMRLANSAYYGVSGKVKTLPFAVTVVGFNAVQATAMSSLLADDLPKSEWEMACTHAVAAGHIAPRLGAPTPDAFCGGLLADLGRPVLRQLSPAGYAALSAQVTNVDDLPEAERSWCGRTHQDVARQVFDAWSFPPAIVGAVAAHHDLPAPDAEPLTVAVAVGNEIAARLLGQPVLYSLGEMTRNRIKDTDLAQMSTMLLEQAEELRHALST